MSTGSGSASTLLTMGSPSLRVTSQSRSPPGDQFSMTGLCVGAEILQVEVPAGAVEHHSRVAAARADLKTSYVRHDLGDQGTQLLLLGEVSRCPA